MAANKEAIFSKSGLIAQTYIPAATAACPTSDGTGTVGTDLFLVATGSAEGNWMDHVRCVFGSHAAGAENCAAGIIRFYIGTVGVGATTPADTHPIGPETACPIQSINHATTAATSFGVAIGHPLPSGQFLLASYSGAMAAHGSLHFSLFAGVY
jgi:hypothetical protein